MKIRTIKTEDHEKIDILIREAFTDTENGYGNESELVNKIRKSNEYVYDLEVVAAVGDEIVGHGLLSEVKIVNEQNSYVGLVLAPLTTGTIYQGIGVGRKIIENLEERATKMNYQFISVLGHPDYYPRFGYVPASNYDIMAPFDVPDEAFMIKPLFENALDNVNGTIKYSSAFN